MSYPKPLSEERIQKMYVKAALNEEQIRFLQDLFEACSNLYGAICLREIWEIYKLLRKANRYPSLHRKDMIAFSEIARRQEHSYRIYEADELYTEEERVPAERILVNSRIRYYMYTRMDGFYNTAEEQSKRPLYVPDDILDFVEMPQSKEETAIRKFLGELVSTADMLETDTPHPEINTNKGKKLKDFIFYGSLDRYIRDDLKDKSERIKRYVSDYNEFLANFEIPVSERIFREMQFRTMTEMLSVTNTVKYMFELISECGAELSEKQADKLLQLFMDYHNNTHLWCANGWKPNELAQRDRSARRGPVQISFGPGIEQMIRNGEYDRAELVRMAEQAGLQVADSSKYGKS